MKKKKKKKKKNKKKRRKTHIPPDELGCVSARMFIRQHRLMRTLFAYLEAGINV